MCQLIDLLIVAAAVGDCGNVMAAKWLLGDSGGGGRSLAVAVA